MRKFSSGVSVPEKVTKQQSVQSVQTYNFHFFLLAHFLRLRLVKGRAALLSPLISEPSAKHHQK